MSRFVVFFNVPSTTERYTYCHTLSRHDSLPISVQRNPDIRRAAVRLAVAVDDGLGNAAIARERFGIAAEADHLIGRARAILEYEARDEQMPAADAQVRLAGDEEDRKSVV